MSKSFVRESELFNPNKKRKFTWYLIFVCFFTSLFYVVFFIFDQTFYDNADSNKIVDVNLAIYNQSIEKIQNIYNDYSNKTRKNSLLTKIFNENIKSEELIIYRFYKAALTRLPLTLINVPHAIKFYALALFYARFRHELSVFCSIRFYFNPAIARRVQIISKRRKSKATNVKFTSNSISESKKSNDETLDSIKEIDTIQTTKAVVECKNIEVKHQFNMFCCFTTKKGLNSKKGFKKCSKKTNDKKNKTRTIKDVLKKFDSDEETESSSIIGFKSTAINFDCRQSLF